MMRLLSILLILAGLAAAALGLARLMEAYMPRSTPPVVDYAEVPPPAPPPEALPPIVAEEDVEPPAEIASVPEGALDEDAFNFQPMLEEAAPSARSAGRGPASAEEVTPSEETVDIEAAPASRAAFIESLQTVPVAHESPRSAEYKRAFDVTFAINATGSGEDATGALPGRGVIGTGEARVSERVEVRLSGAAFSITPTSPPVQLLSPLTENTWRWSVMPLTAGDHELVFEIFAIDQDNVVPLRTFRDRVTVRVSGINRAIAFADQANPLFVLLGGLGSAIAGIVGLARFFRRR